MHVCDARELELNRYRTVLEQNTRNAVTFSDKSAEREQHASGDAMLNAVQTIQDAVDVSVTKVSLVSVLN